MKSVSLLIAIIAGTPPAFPADPAEPFLEDLAPGIVVEKSFVLPKEKTAEFSANLGGKIDRVTNSTVRVDGRTIQVNCVTVADEASAGRVQDKIGKPFPFLFRKDLLIIEHVGKGIDEALALKTSYELGLIAKPDKLRFTLVAELATVDQADYMSCNALFNEFLKQQGGDASAGQRIKALAAQFRFGNSLSLRSPDADASYTFDPLPKAQGPDGAFTTYSFGNLPVRNGVPYITLRYTGMTTSDALSPAAAPPPPRTTAATARWPAGNAKFKSLAKTITKGASGNEEKVQAILEWLEPGANLKYSGQTGSRWGAFKVLEQGFGHCWDFSDVFVTLCRAAGVPCRQVAGWLFGASGHVWAEYHIEGKGWKQVDPTGGGSVTCGIYHIPLFTTEDGEMPIVYLSLPRIKAEQDAPGQPAPRPGTK